MPDPGRGAVVPGRLGVRPGAAAVFRARASSRLICTRGLGGAYLLHAWAHEATSLVSLGGKWLVRQHVPSVSDTKPSLYPDACGPQTSRPVRKASWAKGPA